MFSRVVVGTDDLEEVRVWMLHFRFENGRRMSCETSGSSQRGYR
jgi:hypothetical protein